MTDSSNSPNQPDDSQSLPIDADQPAVSLDLNTASAEELATISGIGPALAERIIARRPYSSVDELTEVQGINDSILERIQPHLVVQPLQADTEIEADLEQPEPDEPAQLSAAEAVDNPVEAELEMPAEEALEAPELAGDVYAEDLPVESYPQEMFAAQAAVEADVQEAAAPEEEPIPPPAGEPEPAPASPTPAPYPQSTAESPAGLSGCSVVWIAVATGLVAAFLAVVFTLGTLAALNGGLRYSRPADISAVQRDFQSLQAESSALGGEVEALRQRMDNLEALSGRVAQVEESTSSLQVELDSTRQELEAANQQLETLTGDMDTLSGEVQALESEIAGLQTSTNRFEDFLGGLGQLLRRVGITLPGSESTPEGDSP